MMIDKKQFLGKAFKDYSDVDPKAGQWTLPDCCETVWHVPLCSSAGDEGLTFEFTKKTDADAFKRDLKALMKKHLEVRGTKKGKR